MTVSDKYNTIAGTSIVPAAFAQAGQTKAFIVMKHISICNYNASSNRKLNYGDEA